MANYLNRCNENLMPQAAELTMNFNFYNYLVSFYVKKIKLKININCCYDKI